MTARFLYVYFMRDRPDRIGEVVPRHVDYWRSLELPGYIGGPFSDRSGGSISFEAESRVDAERVVAGDPFVTAELIADNWLKGWLVE